MPRVEEITREMIFNMGVHRGFNIATYTGTLGEPPKNAKPYDPDEVLSVDELKEIFFSQCSDAESGNRDFSPFEFTAAELNRWEEAADFEVWDSYDAGIQEGFNLVWMEIEESLTNQGVII